MSYYAMLGLCKEPFSLTPDPAFFFRSYPHVQALTRLEIAIRLKRGLSLVVGDVGTGKSTLARTLVRHFHPEQDFLFHMVLDPSYESEFQFLSSLSTMVGAGTGHASALACREAIEHWLFQQGVVEGKTTVLIVDEGQKLSPELLESLRVLLNYETNEYKLLQVVIFAQPELLARIARVPNLMDRVAMKHLLQPLDEEQTGELIRFRLRAAGFVEDRPLFTPDAMRAVHQGTQGYPRKIARLCQRALEELLIRERWEIDASLIHELMADESRWVCNTAA